MTPKEAERYTRKRWQKVHIYSSHQYKRRSEPLYWCVDFGGTLASGYDTRDECVLAAAEFTRQREEEIRTARISKSLLAAFQAAISQDDTDRWNSLQYLYRLLSEKLAALLVGWKEKP